MKTTKNYRLPKKFTKEWIKALRSGEYEQCNGQLYDGKGYCCLGVALAIRGYKFEGDKGEQGFPDGAYKNPNVPRALYDDVEEDSMTSTFASLNDDEGYSFEDIADWIEENVELY